MSVPAGTAAAMDDKLWGTFDQVRPGIYDQFIKPPFDPETGLAPSELEARVDSWLNENADAPRVLQRANVFRIIATKARICVDPHDWFADKLCHGSLLRKLRDRWYREAKMGVLKTESDWFDLAWNTGTGRGLLDMGHISPGWHNMFDRGLGGLIADTKLYRSRLGTRLAPGQTAFYEAVEMVYESTIVLAWRFSAQATKMATEHPEHSERMLAVARVCSRVPAGPPTTFHEVLQFAWLMHELIEMEGELVRSMGHFDRTMYPYFRADVDAGRLTREQAKELIKFFWFKFHSRTRGKANGKNFVLAGQDRGGQPLTNELTWLALEAYEELNTPDPKLSVRFVPGTDERLYSRVADLVRKGHNSFVLMNDVPAIEGMVKQGKTVEDARTYLPIGCYEPAVDGKEAGCTMNIVVSLAKAAELALHDGLDPTSGVQFGPRTGDPQTFTDFEQLYNAYTRQMEFLINRFVEYVGAHERQWPRINPSPLVAGTIEKCLERGKDIGEGGPLYNSVGCVGVGLANACDSLLAIRQAVFEQKTFTIDELIAAMKGNWDGNEPMRLHLANRIPKWGNGQPEADELARRIADHYCCTVHSLRNGRGGPVQAALFTLDYQWLLGQKTSATPDGRRAGESLAPGCGASSGMDREGVTALVNSVTKLDFTETPNGAVVDIMLHPTAVSGQDGLDAFVGLIKTFFSRGGYAVQFNVVDVPTLRDAQVHPEKYATLQIRVTGWSVFFASLSKFEQDQFIHRISHGV
jgi:pyruvate-formate lyase